MDKYTYKIIYECETGEAKTILKKADYFKDNESGHLVLYEEQRAIACYPLYYSIEEEPPQKDQISLVLNDE